MIVKCLKKVSSTMDEALTLVQDLGQNHIQDLYMVLAQEQSAGRGSQGRSWVSPVGGLYVTFILPSVFKPHEISFVVGLALRETLSFFAPMCSLLLKWPNDIIVNNQKIAGILVENHTHPSCILVGVGANIKTVPKVDNVLYSVTSLYKETNRLFPLSILAYHLQKSFEKFYKDLKNHGFSFIRKLWLDASYPLGERVLVSQKERYEEGLFYGIDEGGSLLVKIASGEIACFHHADVTFRSVQ